MAGVTTDGSSSTTATAEAAQPPAVSPDAAAAAPAADLATIGTSTSEDVQLAIRLGWALAEVRGRNWSRARIPTGDALPVEPDCPLPLRPQRTAEELRQQAMRTLLVLADRFQVGQHYGPQLNALTAEFMPSSADAERWQPIAVLIREWDAAIQDELSARSDSLACAYLLGRGLCECYWALGPEGGDPTVDGAAAARGSSGAHRAADGPAAPRGPDGAHPHADGGGAVDRAPTDSWQFLLGPDRRDELNRMLGRTAPQLGPLTPVAVSGSLEAWGCVAADPRWRADPAGSNALYEQLRCWYELLVLRQDPTTLVRPYAMLRARHSALRLWRSFWPQLLLTLIALIAVAGFVVLLTTGSSTPLAKTVLALIGTIGLSLSTVLSKAKDATQVLMTRLRQDSYGDLVAIAATIVPPHPQDRRNGRRRRRPPSQEIVEQAVSHRALTMTTLPPDEPPGGAQIR